MNDAAEHFITQLQLDWNPKTHCSNCGNCIVYRDEDTERMMARCKSNIGKPKLLEQIIGFRSRGWAIAIFCPGYKSMDD